ncbi:hypothetical protein GGI12_004247, partial [Dipsacomyces acuminosporus]
MSSSKDTEQQQERQHDPGVSDRQAYSNDQEEIANKNRRHPSHGYRERGSEGTSSSRLGGNWDAPDYDSYDRRGRRNEPEWRYQRSRRDNDHDSHADRPHRSYGSQKSRYHSHHQHSRREPGYSRSSEYDHHAEDTLESHTQASGARDEQGARDGRDFRFGDRQQQQQQQSRYGDRTD